jgi:hypothetical protein
LVRPCLPLSVPSPEAVLSGPQASRQRPWTLIVSDSPLGCLSLQPWSTTARSPSNHSGLPHPLGILLRTVSDYCYYDRLHFLIKNLDLQPMAFRFCLLQQNLPALLSSCLATGLPGVKCPSGPDVISRRIWVSFRESRAEAHSFLKPCDSIAERTFPVSSIFRVSWTEVHLPRLRLF